MTKDEVAGMVGQWDEAFVRGKAEAYRVALEDVAEFAQSMGKGREILRPLYATIRARLDKVKDAK